MRDKIAYLESRIARLESKLAGSQEIDPKVLAFITRIKDMAPEYYPQIKIKLSKLTNVKKNEVVLEIKHTYPLEIDVYMKLTPLQTSTGLYDADFFNSLGKLIFSEIIELEVGDFLSLLRKLDETFF